ncbi:MAG: hypothetical protein SFV15_12995 [Polyangiaceae bacterium]|nr:hypothetical protein [Polyangiaceae bacterium]
MSEPNSLSLLALLERPIYRRVAIVGVVALAFAMGTSRGIASGFLVLAGAFLLLTLGLLWTSLESLSGKAKLSLDEALSLARPSAEEEQKQSVLRALKDLEFERSVGKISDEDYQELSAHYRAEAKRLMALLDEHHARSRAEVEALARGELAGAKSKAKVEAKVDPVEPSS